MFENVRNIIKRRPGWFVLLYALVSGLYVIQLNFISSDLNSVSIIGTEVDSENALENEHDKDLALTLMLPCAKLALPLKPGVRKLSHSVYIPFFFSCDIQPRASPLSF